MTGSQVAHFHSMARYNAWANGRLLDACVQLTAVEFAAQRVSFFPSLQLTLNHILLVDRNYLADLKGDGRRTIPQDELAFSSASELAAAQRDHDRELIAFCDDLHESDLDRIVAIDRNDGVAYRETVGEILAHLFVHQVHHRGQVHAMLSGTTVAPPQLDEFFLTSDAPNRRVELQRLGISE